MVNTNYLIRGIGKYKIFGEKHLHPIMVIQMQNSITLFRPLTFKDDFMYLYQVRDVDGDCQSLSVVKFLDYDPCPAFVIVQIMDGRRLRCLRENIFAIGEKHHDSNNVQLAGVFRRHPVKRIIAELDEQD